MGRRVLIYVRLSRDREGAHLGVDRQQSECEALATILDWQVVGIHSDNDVSAYSGKPRPGYRALLDDLRGGHADAVIAWHTDRLQRSPRELEAYVDVCEQRAVLTQTVKAGQMDLCTPSGRMVARQLGTVARYEVEHLVERMKSQKSQAAAAGEWRGGPRPYGYEADGITVRESEATEVRWASTSVLSGMSLHAIAAELNSRGVLTTTGKPWRAEGLRRVLLRARNAGLVEHHEDIVGKAQWDAIVAEDLWRAVRGLLLDPARRTNTLGGRRRWLGSGLYLCGECSEVLTTGRTSDGRPIYRCSSRKHVSRDAGCLDGLVEDVVLGRLKQPDAARLLIQDPVDTTPLHQAIEVQRMRLDELAREYTAGVIDARQLREGSESGRARLREIEGELASATRTTELDALIGVPDIAEVWAGLDLSRRRAVVSSLVDVTVHRSPLGKVFHPESIKIEWRD
jgi:site-specific DNA recombinase